MQPEELINHLQEIFPEQVFGNVLKSLRQDPLVWESLKDEELFEKLREKTKASIEAGGNTWTPAQIALILMGIESSPDELSGESPKPLEESERSQAIGAYESFLVNRSIPASLEDAGWLALALRERRLVNENWDGFGQEIFHETSDSLSEETSLWRTILNILFGLVADPLDMLKTFIRERSAWPVYELASHIIFSNTWQPDMQIKLHIDLMERLSISQQLEWLRGLNQTGSEKLVQKVASTFIGRLHKAHGKPERKKWSKNMSIDRLVNRAIDNGQLAQMYRLAKQNSKSMEFLSDAQEAMRKILAGMEITYAETAMDAGDHDAALAGIDQILKLQDHSIPLEEELALVLDDSAQANSLLGQLNLEQANPLALIKKAGMLNDLGEKDEAETLARNAVSSLAEIVATDDQSLFFKNIADWNPVSVIQVLENLGLDEEALQVSLLFLKERPSDVDLINRISKVLQKMGEVVQARTYARMAVAYEPGAKGYRRELAALYEKTEDFSRAQQEWERLAAATNQAEDEDWIGVARSAYQLGNCERALEACNRVIKNNSVNSEATVIMGKSLMKLDRYQEATTHLNQAVLLDPSYPEIWLGLVQCYQENKQANRAMETLRSAVLALPGSADINFAMADAYIQSGALNEGLPFLRKAANLAPESIECTLRLADTLAALGKLNEAGDVLESARKKWGIDTRLAQLHAQILISLGKQDEAIPALEIALKTPVPDFGLYLLHGKTLLGSENAFLTRNSELDAGRIVNAQQSLEKALILEPNNAEARLLMAEVLGARGVYSNAFNVYRRLSEEKEALEGLETWRVAGGLGLSALKLHQIDTSLAALREAVEDNPGNVFLQQALAEASLEAALPTEAQEAAKTALGLAPDDIENLTWYANLAVSMGNHDDAVRALQVATQLAPSEPDFWIRLAELQLQMGDQDSGKDTIQKLLSTAPEDVDQLYRAVGVFIKNNDFEVAREYLERAAQENGLINSSLNFVLACLYARTSEFQAALEKAQEAIDENPEDAGLYTFASDLYELLGRPQAALASLDHAEKAAKSRTGTESIIDQCARLVGDILPPAWMDALSLQSGLALRSVNLLCELGEYLTAVERMDAALEANPQDIDLQYWDADLNRALFREDKVKEILNFAEADDDPVSLEHPSGMATSRFTTWLILNCLRAEVLLDMDRIDNARNLAENLAKITTEHPRLTALQVRLAGIDGDVDLAKARFDELKKTYLQSTIDKDNHSTREAGNIFHYFLNRRDLSHVFAAQAAREWEDAVEFAMHQVSTNPHEPRTHLVHAQIRTEQAEQYYYHNALRSQAHSPDKTIGSEESEKIFEKSIQDAGSCGQASAIGHWEARGELVFHPSGQAVRSLLEKGKSQSDTFALVMGLHRLDNDAAAFQISKKNPGDKFVQGAAAFCLIKNEPEKALDLAKEVFEARPNDPLSGALVGMTAQASGDAATAKEMLEKSLSIWPEETQWHLWAADLSEKLGDPDGQIDHLETASKTDTGNVDIVIRLAEVCLANDLPEKTIQLMETVSRIDPENPKIWYLTGLGYLQNKQFKAAIDCGERAAALDLKDPTPYILCGRAAMAEGRHDLAGTYIDSGLLRDAKNVQLFLLRSNLLVSQGKMKEAVKVVDQALSGNPDQIDLLFERARLINQTDGPQAALPYAVEMVRIFPQDVKCLTFLAKTLFEVGNMVDAEKAVQRASKFAPDSKEISLLQGKIHLASGQLDQAVSDFSYVIETDPENLDAYLELGKTYHARREIHNAIKTLQAAITFFSKDTRPYVASAQIYKDIKDYSNAETMLRKAASINPDDLSIRRQMSAMIALNLVNNTREVNPLS